MKITGKEMKLRSVNTTVKVTHFFEVKCCLNSEFKKRIWGKRKCFICKGKFKDGDSPVACITKKGLNKIICEKCYSGLMKENKQ